MNTPAQTIKYTLIAITTALLMVSMTVFAAPFTPGQILDPGCSPGAVDCYVANKNIYNADGALDSDRMISLDGYQLASSGDGSINFSSTLSNGNEGFLQVSDDILGLEAAGVFPVGAGIKGAGFFVQDGDLLLGGVLNRILVGDFTGSNFNNGFNIGAGDLGGLQPESHIQGLIDVNPGSSTEGSSELTIRSTARNSGTSHIEIDSVEDNPAGNPTLQLEVNNNTNGHQFELSMDGVRVDTYTLPWTDGAANQVLQTDGAGQLAWATVGGGGGSDTNFSTTDLTFPAKRTHNLNGYGVDFQNGDFGLIASDSFLDPMIPGGFKFYGAYNFDSTNSIVTANGVRDFGGSIESTGSVANFATGAESFYILDTDEVQISRKDSSGGGNTIYLKDSGIELQIGSSGTLKIQGLPIYADDATAGGAGLSSGDMYMTATGELRIKI